MTTLAEIATILRTTEKNLPARIAGLKLGDVCGRCCGTGAYSFNSVDGTRCYGCGGGGQVMPKTPQGLEALKTRACEAVAAGKLEPYLEEVAARRRVKTAEKVVFGAWGEIFKTYPYNWMQAAQEDRAGLQTLNRWRADQNKICADAQTRFSRVLERHQYPSKKDPVRVTALEVEQALAETLAVIAEVRARVAARGDE